MTWGPCTNCVHADAETFCAAPPNQGFPFVGCNMPDGEGCTKHVRRCYSCDAEAVNFGDVPRCDNCAEAAWLRQQNEAQ